MKRGILIVEDDADLGELLKLTIELAGSAECVLAASLADVQRQASAALACDLAILDVNLGAGEPTGVEVCAWLREHGFHGSVVFLTGHAADDPRVRAAAHVADSRILSKPIGFKEISQLVDAP